MKIRFRRNRLSVQDGFHSQHRSIVAASLVTLILVSCGARVAEDRAVSTPASGNQAALVEVETESGQGTPRPLPSSRDSGLTLDDGRQPPNRQTEIRSDPESSGVKGQQQAPKIRGVQTVSAREADSTSYSNRFATPVDSAWYTGPEANRENYLEIEENSVRLVAEQPVSTFSIDVDTAAYSNIRRMIMQEGRLPPHDAVRLEEMINYFDYDYRAPDSLEEPLAIHTELAPSPWNVDNRLLMVGIQGFEPDPAARPAANLVFLVDVSGSMNSPDKLGLVQRSMKLLVDQMQERDRIALVVYAGAAGMVLDSTSASEKSTIGQAIDSLRAGGSTNGAAGIQLAYQIAERHKIEGGINRVVIASDGDLNVGVTDIEALKELIGIKRQKGIALTTLGFGTGNYNYSLMEQIADVGNGNAAYIDSLNEARKVLVEEMQSTLLTIAKDVKIQIEFNPALVKEYRLLGYENRLLNREDFINDKVDAGEIGAGHTVTALYELTLTDSTGGLIPTSRYQAVDQELQEDLAGELAFIKVRHKPADGDVSTESGRPVLLIEERQTEETSDSFRFAAAVAGFGQLLRGGKYSGELDYDQVLNLARGARGPDVHGYRSELLNLVAMAKLL